MILKKLNLRIFLETLGHTQLVSYSKKRLAT
jgi:hypothetical protein